jgi:hypothetical protein
VPLELKTLEVTDNGRHPRNTQDEVFTSVVADMTTAAGLLPWPKDLPASETGRATRGAALGYLGAAQIWLKKYPEAIAAYDQLIPEYHLLEKYLDIHEYNNQTTRISSSTILIPSGGTRSWGRSNDAHWLQSFNMPEEITAWASSLPALNCIFI